MYFEKEKVFFYDLMIITHLHALNKQLFLLKCFDSKA